MRIAKHGNRSVSSQCGSADVLEALGVNIQAAPAIVEQCLGEVGVAFLFAPTFHPAMKHAAQARKDLGVRTAFNLLGPLTNPARPARQIVGVPRPELTELLARSLSLLGSERAWVVHGADGLDELSTTGYTKVSECRGTSVQTFYVHPADFGLAKALAGIAEGRRCGDQRRDRASGARRRAGPPARRRAAERRRGAVCRRRGRHGQGRHRQGRGGDRQRRGGGGADEADRGVESRRERRRERDARPARGDRRAPRAPASLRRSSASRARRLERRADVAHAERCRRSRSGCRAQGRST